MKGSIGSRIRKFREDAGMSQRELAKVLGISQPAIWMWERGETKGKNPGQPITPKADKLASIARALNVTVDELLGVRRRKAA